MKSILGAVKGSESKYVQVWNIFGEKLLTPGNEDAKQVFQKWYVNRIVNRSEQGDAS